MKPPVFLTGATGFLGMEVLARLLEKGDREVVALVRAADDAAAAGAPGGRAWPSSGATRRRTASARAPSPATSPRPASGMDAGERAAVAEEVGAVMHCAASISFDLPLDEARADQRRGHARDHRLRPRGQGARAPGPLHPRLHRVRRRASPRARSASASSTPARTFRNTYEQTKWEAEHVVNDASDLDPVIARPSIVMGESGSGWTPAFNVLYWPIRAFSRGLFDEVPARPEALVDVVPVDYVADALVHLLEDTSSSGVVNLVVRPRGLHGRRPGRR